MLKINECSDDGKPQTRAREGGRKKRRKGGEGLYLSIVQVTQINVHGVSIVTDSTHVGHGRIEEGVLGFKGGTTAFLLGERAGVGKSVHLGRREEGREGGRVRRREGGREGGRARTVCMS